MPRPADLSSARTATRYGAVLVFKPGTSREAAEAALTRLKDVIDPNYYYPPSGPKVNSFNPEHSGPVWYVP